MNIWEIDKVLLFIVLVLPGFISLKVYNLIVANKNRDFSKSVVEAVCYSILNFSILSWLILIISKGNFNNSHPVLYWASIALIFVIAPTAWPFIFLWLSKLKFSDYNAFC